MTTTNGDFTVSATSTCLQDTAIAVEKSCVINVTFTPQAVGTRFGGLIITDDDGGVANSQQVVALMGTGVAVQTPQSGTAQPQTATSLAGNQGIPLKTDLTVKGNVSMQAVLIPYHVARRVFGREIAANYAVIELIANNKSPDATLIIQGLYIDYTDWALSGSIRPDAVCTETADKDDKSTYQACTRPNQVASEEYRVVRGEALDTQPFTARNLIVGMLGLGGSIASAYSFSIAEKGIVKGISAINGTVVPGLSALWPDQTVAQMNRISDVGYQTNKVIPKQGSDIIVGFFPIDRFLTPSFRKLFKNSPSVFFNPFEALVDADLQQTILDALPSGLVGKDPAPLVKALPCYYRYRAKLAHQKAAAENVTPATTDDSIVSEAALDRDCKCKLKDSNTVLALDLIAAMSLNNIRVVVDGVMTVETASLPAKIESVEFDNEKTNATLWTDTSKPLTGTIKGSYLTSGTPQIQGVVKDSGASIVAVSDGSTDQALKFSLTLKSAIKDGAQITFVVEKTAKDASGAAKKVDSTPFIYTVHSPAGNTPQIDSITFDGDQTNPALWTDAKGTLKGVIRGQRLLAGDTSISIKEAKDLGIPDFKPEASSTDLMLDFSFQLSKAIDEGKVLTFTVQTKPKDANGAETTATSADYAYTVYYVPAITSVTVDHDKDNLTLWTNTPATVTGTITGKNLKDCTPAIAEAKELEITVKSSDTAKPDDSNLVFSFQIKKTIENGTKLTFTAVKTIKDANSKGKPPTSNKSVYEVKYAPAPAKPAPKQPPKKTSTAAKGKSTAGGTKP
jgi:hypothetical protein